MGASLATQGGPRPTATTDAVVIARHLARGYGDGDIAVDALRGVSVAGR
jgi:hypothetical protein